MKSYLGMGALYTFLFTLALVALCLLLLGIRVFFKKGGKFPNFHIEQNAHLRKKGIGCAAAMDRKERERK